MLPAANRKIRICSLTDPSHPGTAAADAVNTVRDFEDDLAAKGEKCDVDNLLI